MTTLDRAFVRAFQRRTPSAAASPNEAFAAAGAVAPVADAKAVDTAESGKRASAPHRELRGGDVLSALQQGPKPTATARAVTAGKADVVSTRPTGVRIRVDRSVAQAAPTFDQLANLSRTGQSPAAQEAPLRVAPQEMSSAPTPIPEPAATMTAPDKQTTDIRSGEPVLPAHTTEPSAATAQEPCSPALQPDSTSPFMAANGPAVEVEPPLTSAPAPLAAAREALTPESELSPTNVEQSRAADENSATDYVAYAVPENTAVESFDSAAAESAVFRPGLQVDAFLWPEVCTRLEHLAGAQLDQLADELVGPDRRQHRVVAVAGVQSGVGCSTLALCLARRLALGGLQVVLVDADLETPALAESLGLAVECGWEQPLAGECALDEVLVESLADRLALLPRVEPLALDALAALRMESHLNRLREQYEVVLLDWGALGVADIAESLAFHQQAARPDLVLLMDDTRTTSADQLAALMERLETNSVAMVENFVSS